MFSMNRRDVVKLMAIGCVGCGGGDETPPDAAPPGFELCGGNVCVSLLEPVNAALLEVNGVRALNIPDKIIVVRTSATEFAVLSRVCTHNSCTVGYQAATMQLACPCHGSRFSLTGAVVKDPATRSLKTYASSFDDATQVLTIVLA
jgi:cytochrome b6-f complex iron-sulfur subunit